MWNGHSKTFWTLTFELLGRNIAPLHFKTKRVGKTAWHASWFWTTSAQFTGTWEIFSCAGDSKLTAEGLGLDWNGQSETDRTLDFQFLGRNIAQLHFKTEKEAETCLRASWFWASLAGFPGTWGIVSRRGDSKLTPYGLGLQWNGHSKALWTLTFEVLGRNIAPLNFKPERLAETAFTRIVILTNFDF